MTRLDSLVFFKNEEEEDYFERSIPFLYVVFLMCLPAFFFFFFLYEDKKTRI